MDETKLWHTKLGYLNLRSMRKIFFENTIIGLHNIKIEEGKLRGGFHIGKHTKISHKKVQYLTTSKVLELLHMDLMGPMQL